VISLQQTVARRTAELSKTLRGVEEANGHIMASIRYAKNLQESMLPSVTEIRTYLPDSFFIWKPRDIVGGDIFYADRFESGFLIAVIDCTGTAFRARL